MARLANDLLFSLCFSQLLDIKDTLKKRNTIIKEEVNAQFKIVDSLFNLAAGAAMENQMPSLQTTALKNLRSELHILLKSKMVNKYRLSFTK